MIINFENLIIKPGYIRVDYNDDETSHFIEFELSTPILVREDLIAIVISTLCGQKYDYINIELEVTPHVQKHIERFTKSKLICKTKRRSYVHTKSFGNHTLNFSGGFDSLAALSFLPKNSSLVSVDFGGHFSREMDIINSFNSYVVKTNILETNFRKNSWLFMFMGAILYKDYLNTDYNISGGVIGAGSLKNINFLKNYKTSIPIESSDMTSIPYTLGLSEIAAIKVALNNSFNLIDMSLKSLANPKEEKRYRKQTMLEIINEQSSSKLSLENIVPPPEEPFSSWGDNLLHDHLSLYVIKYKGYEFASTITSDIPESAIQLVEKLEMEYYERYNTDVVKYIPREFREKFFKVLNHSDILPYDRNDWIEYHQSLHYLSKYHKISGIKFK